MDHITFETFSESIKKIKKSLRVNSLFYGYIKALTLDKIIEYFNKNLNFTQQADNTNPNVNNFSSYVDLLHNHHGITGSFAIKVPNEEKSENSHVVANYYQVGKMLLLYR